MIPEIEIPLEPDAFEAVSGGTACLIPFKINWTGTLRFVKIVEVSGGQRTGRWMASEVIVPYKPAVALENLTELQGITT